MTPKRGSAGIGSNTALQDSASYIIVCREILKLIKELHMLKFGKCAIVALAISALTMGLSSCKKEDSAEKAGKEIDKTVEEAKQKLEKVEKAGEKMKEAAKEVIKK
jgi:hypothetical protein